MRRFILIAALLPLPVLSQTDDRGYLTAFLEDNLSGLGREVVITGFAGALSSRAQIEEMTIADGAGIWLTLRDVTLDWNRAALFSGKVAVNTLSAGEIIVARLPQNADAAPKAEASSFALPELPVSVQIGKLGADRIVLGAGVLGQPVVGRLEAALLLEGGEGNADLVLERLDDGPEGRITLTASYSNADKELAIDLSAVEGAGGLAVGLLGLPGAPSAALNIRGNGPFSDFSASISLATDGIDRLVGQVSTQVVSETVTGFSADLSGDLAPLFLPEYAAFFGDQIGLKATGQRFADGRFDLSKLILQARAVALSGKLQLDSEGQPLAFDLTGQIAQDDGQAVLLPLTTDLPLRVKRAEIILGYDRVKGDGWTGIATISGLDRADFEVSQMTLAGAGQIRPGTFDANLRFNAEGLQPKDAALSAAIGSTLSGDALLSWDKAGGALKVSSLLLQGQYYSARVTQARIEDFALSGKMTADLADLSRLSGLAGHPLSGAAEMTVAGSVRPMTGAFDLELQATGTDITTGIAELDGLLRGKATIAASAQRGTTGTELRRLSVTANELTGSVAGQFKSAGSMLTGTMALSDLSVLGRGYGGALSGDITVDGSLKTARVGVQATGRDLRIGQPEADRLLAGQSKLDVNLALNDGILRVDRVQVSNPQVTVTAKGAASEALDIDARLQNLALLMPEFPGSLTVKGVVVQSTAGTRIDLAGQGPGGIDATMIGNLSPSFDSGNLVIKGRAQAALANAFVSPRAMSGVLGFDLALNGPLALRSVSGSVTLEAGRIADPSQSFAFQNIQARATLASGQANLTASLPVSTGGEVAIAGTIGLSEPFSAALGVGLKGVVLRDPDLYETRINGKLTVIGPLAGRAAIAGVLALGETEFRVPSTGFGGAGGLPDLRHIGEPGDVRATRQRAGMLEKASEGASPGGGVAYGLDVTISALNQVFIRGRGLDAELGGELRLLGTTNDVQPAGAFNLIRGRLDILGKRLNLDETLLQLEGELVPFLRVVANTENDGITSSVIIQGPADDPKVSFTSEPELPEEEVLAQLLFGQVLQNLSALQALQLANAVATLAGRGGDGIVSRLRQGFGLDNLDVKTNAEGGAEITVGKYITKKIYSEVTLDDNGKSQIDLNLDVTDTITLRGRASSDGDSGIGIYLDKDY
jgi:translocation and assembly module TamB